MRDGYVKTLTTNKDAKMSRPLTVSIPHALGRDEAVRRLKSGLAKATKNMPMVKIEDERWDGDRLDLRVRAMGQAASGRVDVLDDRVDVEVTLPWLLQRFAEVAQAAIRSRGKLLLEKK